MPGWQVLPGIAQLPSPSRSMANLLQWVSAAAPAQPAVLLCWEPARWCSWGGQLMCKVTSGISLRASSPLLWHPTQSKHAVTNEKAGPGGRGWRREVRVNCTSDAAWAQMLTQPRRLSRDGLQGRNRLGLCLWASSFTPTWQPEKSTALTIWEGTTLLERRDNLEVVFPVTNSNPSCKIHRGQIECVFMGVWS